MLRRPRALRRARRRLLRPPARAQPPEPAPPDRRGRGLVGGLADLGPGGRLRGESFAGQAFRFLQLERVVLEDCDLSNCEWELPRLEEVELSGCRLTGFRIKGGKGIELKLRECHGRYAQFENVELKEARFERCQLGESSFIGCALDRAVFSECDLRGTVLSGVRLRGADLRGCQVDGIRATLDDLAGATLDPRQAAAILHGHANITVLEIGES